MALSEKERRVLEELEQQLSTEDPRLASQMQGSGPVSGFSTRNIVIGVLVAAVGIVVLLWGVTISQIWLGVVGFLLMAGGVFFATVTPKHARKGKDKSDDGSKPAQQSSSFMSNLEAKWNERRRQQP